MDALETAIFKGIKKAKLEITKKLISKGVYTFIISLSTGLTEDDIKKLK
jgi:hypothetical protein